MVCAVRGFSAEQVEVHILLFFFLLHLLLFLGCASVSTSSSSAASSGTTATTSATTSSTSSKLAVATGNHLMSCLAIHLTDDPVEHLFVNADATCFENCLHIICSWGLLASQDSHKIRAKVLHGHL